MLDDGAASRLTRLKARIHRLLSIVLPERVLDHYVMPVVERRAHRPYDAKRFFDSYYRATGAAGLSDRTTISPYTNRFESTFHYNSVENSIILSLTGRALPDAPRVLDVGSGAGHWIDFYREVLGASMVTSVDISPIDVRNLRTRYKSVKGVKVVEADVAQDSFDLGARFDIVNAVGVLFHIVDDARWEQALRNLRHHLADDGLLVVGGQFGYITQNVQFHETDDFSDFDELRATRAPVVLVNKRIRSIGRWRSTAERVGLRIVSLQRTKHDRRIRTPENNVLVLQRSARVGGDA